MDNMKNIIKSQTKMNDNTQLAKHSFVNHTYVDRSQISVISSRIQDGAPFKAVGGMNGNVKSWSFILKLHYILDKESPDKDEEEGQGQVQSIISWRKHGRAFRVNNIHRFENETLKMYFRHVKYSSFQRMLNLYGFKRIVHGSDHNCYYHEYFLRGFPQFHEQITIQRNKGTKVRATSKSCDEPNFYRMPYVNGNGLIMKLEHSTIMRKPECMRLSSWNTKDSETRSLCNSNLLCAHIRGHLIPDALENQLNEDKYSPLDEALDPFTPYPVDLTYEGSYINFNM